MKTRIIAASMILVFNSLIAMKQEIPTSNFTYLFHKNFGQEVGENQHRITFDHYAQKDMNEKETFLGQGQGLAIQATNFSPSSLCYYLKKDNSSTVHVYKEITAELFEFTVPESYFIYSACYSPNGNFLALVVDDNNQITTETIFSIIDTQTQQEVKKIPNSYAGVKTLCLAYSPDGGFLVATPFLNAFQPITVYDFTQSKEFRKFSPPEGVAWMASSFTTEFSLLAAGADDNNIYLFNIQSREQIGVLTGHALPVCCLSFSPDNNYLASSSMDGTVKIWNIETKECMTLKGDHMIPIYAVAWNKAGNLLASGNYNGLIKLWNPQTGDLLQELPNPTKDPAPVVFIQFSEDGNSMMSQNFFYTVCFWEQESEQESKPVLKQEQKAGYCLLN